MLDTYLCKKSAAGAAKTVTEAATGNPLVRALIGSLTGGGIATEAGAMYRNDEHNITNLKPAIFQIGSNPEVRKDFVLGFGLGAGSGMASKNYATSVVGGLSMGTLEPSIRNAATGLYLQGESSKELAAGSKELANSIATSSKEMADSNTTNNILLGALGVGALGLGGYALYKYLAKKEEEKAAPPKVKVRLKGSDKDPYDDATVEVPLHNLKVTQNLEQGVNRSMRRVLRENNKFSGKKKDPITGKLISYQEYVDKYGEPVKNKKKKFTPDLAPTPTGPTLDNNTKDQEVKNMDSLNTYDQYNASI